MYLRTLSCFPFLPHFRLDGNNISTEVLQDIKTAIEYDPRAAEKRRLVEEKAAADEAERIRLAEEKAAADEAERIRLAEEKAAEPLRLVREQAVAEEAERIRLADAEQLAVDVAAWEAAHTYIKLSAATPPTAEGAAKEDIEGGKLRVCRVESISTTDGLVTAIMADGTKNSEFKFSDYAVASEDEWQKAQSHVKFLAVLAGIRDNSIAEIALKNAGINDSEAEQLANALMLDSNSKVTRIDLSFNEIGERGGAALATALTSNSASAVETVYLRGNKLGYRGAESFAMALKANSKLRKLGVSGNDVGDKGATALFLALKSNTTLEMLNLHKNNIGDDSMPALSNVLLLNTSGFSQINLSDNQISDRGALTLAKGVGVNTTVAHLDLKRNQISDDGAASLFRAYSENRNSALRRFGLEGNNISMAPAVAGGEEAGGFAAAVLAKANAENYVQAINAVIAGNIKSHKLKQKALDWQSKWPYVLDSGGNVAKVKAVSQTNLTVTLIYPNGRTLRSKDTIDGCIPSTKAVFDVAALQSPGCRVVRSSDWSYAGNPDGAPGMKGMVVRRPTKLDVPVDDDGEPVPGFVCVLWDYTTMSGTAGVGVYMCGYDNKYTLQFADSSRNDWLGERAIVYDQVVVEAAEVKIAIAAEKEKARAQRKASRAGAAISGAKGKSDGTAVDGKPDNGDTGSDVNGGAAKKKPLSEKLVRKITIPSGYTSAKLLKAMCSHGSLFGATLAIIILAIQVILLGTSQITAKADLDLVTSALLPVNKHAEPACTVPAPFCCDACLSFDLNCSAGCIEPPSSGFPLLLSKTFPGAQECCPSNMDKFSDSLNLMFSLTLAATIVAMIDGIYHAYTIYKGEKTQKKLEAEAKAKKLAEAKSAAETAAAAASDDPTVAVLPPLVGDDDEGIENGDGNGDGYLAVEQTSNEAAEGKAEGAVGAELAGENGDGDKGTAGAPNEEKVAALQINNEKGEVEEDARDHLLHDPVDPSLFEWRPIPTTSFKLLLRGVRIFFAGEPAQIQNHRDFTTEAEIGSPGNPVQHELVPKDMGIFFYLLPAVHVGLFIFMKTLQAGAVAEGTPISCYGCEGSSLWGQGVDIVENSTKSAGRLGTALTVLAIIGSLLTFISIASRDAEESFLSALKDSVVDLGESLGIFETPPPAQPLQPAMFLDKKKETFIIMCHPCDQVDDGGGGGGGGSGVAVDSPILATIGGVWLVFTLDGSRPAVDSGFLDSMEIALGPDNVQGTLIKGSKAAVSAADAGMDAADLIRCRAISVRWVTTATTGVTKVSVSNETVCELSGEVLSSLPPDAPLDDEDDAGFFDPALEAEMLAREEAERLAAAEAAAAAKASAEAALAAKFAEESARRRQLIEDANNNKRNPTGFPMEIPGADPLTMGSEITRGAHPELGHMTLEVGDVVVTPGPVHRWRYGKVEQILAGTNVHDHRFVHVEMPKCTVRYVTRTVQNAVQIVEGDPLPSECFSEEICRARNVCMCASWVKVEEPTVIHVLKQSTYGKDWFFLWPASSEL